MDPAGDSLRERYGIVLVGDAPRALAVSHARLPDRPTVLVGGSLPGVPSAPTLDEALATLGCEIAIVAAAALVLEPADADRLAALTAGHALVAATIEGSPAHAQVCVAGRREALAATGLEALAAAAVTTPRVRVRDGSAAAFGDDPRRVRDAAEPWQTRYARDAARGVVHRTLRTPMRIDLALDEPAPPADVVVLGEPAERGGFERALRANATPLRAIRFVHENDVAAADSALRNRGDRYVVFLRADAPPPPGRIDALCAALERDVLAAVATDGAGVVQAAASAFAAARMPYAAALTALPSVPEALAELAQRLERDYDRGLRFLDPPAAAPVPAAGERAPRFTGIASIVMLSWNAPQFTRTAVESIRAVTRYPHEIIVVDNGSGPQTRAVLEELVREHGIRAIYNERNLGFGMGMNVGIAAARGDAVVLLNNDIVAGEGWLESLIGALELRRGVGVTAPRSNKVVGPQVLAVPYADPAEMGPFVAQRRAEHAGEGFWIERVIGFCMCFDRRVLEEVGGFDPLYGLGNFEDDDLCIRVRAAGWGIFVCDDSYIHHIGHGSFTANKLDYRGIMEANWRAFTRKWALGESPLGTPYNSRLVIARGFERERDFVPFQARP